MNNFIRFNILLAILIASSANASPNNNEKNDATRNAFNLESPYIFHKEAKADMAHCNDMAQAKFIVGYDEERIWDVRYNHHNEADFIKIKWAESAKKWADPIKFNATRDNRNESPEWLISEIERVQKQINEAREGISKLSPTYLEEYFNLCFVFENRLLPIKYLPFAIERCLAYESMLMQELGSLPALLPNVNGNDESEKLRKINLLRSEIERTAKEDRERNQILIIYDLGYNLAMQNRTASAPNLVSPSAAVSSDELRVDIPAIKSNDSTSSSTTEAAAGSPNQESPSASSGSSRSPVTSTPSSPLSSDSELNAASKSTSATSDNEDEYKGEGLSAGSPMNTSSASVTSTPSSSLSPVSGSSAANGNEIRIDDLNNDLQALFKQNSDAANGFNDANRRKLLDTIIAIAKIYNVLNSEHIPLADPNIRPAPVPPSSPPAPAPAPAPSSPPARNVIDSQDVPTAPDVLAAPDTPEAPDVPAAPDIPEPGSTPNPAASPPNNKPKVPKPTPADIPPKKPLTISDLLNELKGGKKLKKANPVEPSSASSSAENPDAAPALKPRTIKMSKYELQRMEHINSVVDSKSSKAVTELVANVKEDWLAFITKTKALLVAERLTKNAKAMIEEHFKLPTTLSTLTEDQKSQLWAAFNLDLRKMAEAVDAYVAKPTKAPASAAAAPTSASPTIKLTPAQLEQKGKIIDQILSEQLQDRYIRFLTDKNVTKENAINAWPAFQAHIRKAFLLDKVDWRRIEEVKNYYNSTIILLLPNNVAKEQTWQSFQVDIQSTLKKINEESKKQIKEEPVKSPDVQAIVDNNIDQQIIEVVANAKEEWAAFITHVKHLFATEKFAKDASSKIEEHFKLPTTLSGLTEEQKTQLWYLFNVSLTNMTFQMNKDRLVDNSISAAAPAETPSASAPSSSSLSPEQLEQRGKVVDKVLSEQLQVIYIKFLTDKKVTKEVVMNAWPAFEAHIRKAFLMDKVKDWKRVEEVGAYYKEKIRLLIPDRDKKGLTWESFRKEVQISINSVNEEIKKLQDTPKA